MVQKDMVSLKAGALNKRLFVMGTTLVALVLTMMISNCCPNIFIHASEAELTQTDQVAQMISKISESEIHNTVYHLQNFTTRCYGYSGNVAAATWLFSKLSSISGLSVEYQGPYNNVIATLYDVDNASDAIYVVGAHYDSISSDPNNAPGCTDNGGGVAIVLELARIMSQYSFNHTIKFAFWNCEENGLLGSTDYVSFTKTNNLNVSLYLNYDSSCYDPDNRFVLDIMYNVNSERVSDLMTSYNSLYSIGFNLTYNIHTCSSDHRPFWDNGNTAVMTHSDTHGTMPHTPSDTIEKVSTSYARKNGQLGMSVLATLAEFEGSTPTPTSMPTPTSTPVPTLTPTPTAKTTSTPIPTLSPSPSPTAQPSSSTSLSPLQKTVGLPPETFYAIATFAAAVIVVTSAIIIKKQRNNGTKTVLVPHKYSYLRLFNHFNPY